MRRFKISDDNGKACPYIIVGRYKVEFSRSGGIASCSAIRFRAPMPRGVGWPNDDEVRDVLQQLREHLSAMADDLQHAQRALREMDL